MIFETTTIIKVFVLLIAWIGHAFVWCSALNHLYGRPISKKFLTTWRFFTGLVIVFGFPALVWILSQPAKPYNKVSPGDLDNTLIAIIFDCYMGICFIIGCIVIPVITVLRFLAHDPESVIKRTSIDRDLRAIHGDGLYGDGTYRRFASLPFNDVFNVEFIDLTLKYESLPEALEGLTILFLSDFHFYGSPSKLYFEAIIDEIEGQPLPDIVALGGDFIDSRKYHDWLEPLLGRLKWKDAGFAILGNHDHKYEPDAIRSTLKGLGFTVLSNRWQSGTIRGEQVIFVGHEGPWVRPAPGDRTTPADSFRICFSHTPDNFPWAVKNQIDLVLAGHTHGGQIRLPIIGSIFVPSIYGRRYDQGVFKKGRTTMVVGRGISGKEPLRFRCRPQVLRITLSASRRE